MDDQDKEANSNDLKKKLLKKKINGEDSMLLKSEDLPPCNRAVVMDLRHEMVSEDSYRSIPFPSFYLEVPIC